MAGARPDPTPSPAGLPPPTQQIKIDAEDGTLQLMVKVNGVIDREAKAVTHLKQLSGEEAEEP